MSDLHTVKTMMELIISVFRPVRVDFFGPSGLWEGEGLVAFSGELLELCDLDPRLYDCPEENC